MPRRRSLVRAAALLAVLVLLAASHSVRAVPGAATAEGVHGPISIDGNAAFTSENGVISGQGTSSDPYLIADWEISGSASLGVQLRNTDAFVILRNLTVLGYQVGFFLSNVRNARLENVTSVGNVMEGVRVESSDHVSVIGSHVSYNGAGLVFLGTTNASVAGNEVTWNDRYGILLQDSPDARVAGNVVAWNSFEGGNGLGLLSSPNATISANEFTDDGIVLGGLSVDAYDSHTIPADNLVDGLPVRYLKGCDDVTLDGLFAGQLLLANCRHVRVANLSLPASDAGVLVAYGSDIVLGPNLRVVNATVGISLQSASNVRIAGAVLLDVAYGVVVASSRDVALSRTKVSSRFSFGVLGSGAGVLVQQSSQVNVSSNVVEYSFGGVVAAETAGLVVVGNKLDSNLGPGVDLWKPRDVLVEGNKLTRNGGGIRVALGGNVSIQGNAIYLNGGPGVELTNSSAVRFLSNDVVSNVPPQAIDNLGPENLWDSGYPEGGNHWSDFLGADACSGPNQDVCTGGDGIGDTPYVIDGNSTDRYPLMRSPVSIDTPPDALFTLTPRSGDTRTSFRVDASASSDLEDASTDLRFRWDWEDDGSWDTAWSADPRAEHVYAQPGNYTIRLEVRDRAGGTDEWTASVSVSPSPDVSPPDVRVAAPTTASAGAPIRVAAEVTDPSGIASVVLYYRGVRDAEFHAVGMGYTSGAEYVADIPPQGAAGSVAFYVVAEDSLGNRAREPATGEYTVQVVDTTWPWVLVGLGTSGAVATAAYLLWRRRRRLLYEPLQEVPRGPPENP